MGAIPFEEVYFLNDCGSPGWGCAEVEERLLPHVARAATASGSALGEFAEGSERSRRGGNRRGRRSAPRSEPIELQK